MRLLLPLILLLSITGCGQTNDQAADNAQACSQANAMLDKAAAGELRPRDWANMMTAGARLLYVDNSCGDRVANDRMQSCSELGDKITTFAASRKVPRNENRNTAIKQNLRVYRNAGCTPALTVE